MIMLSYKKIVSLASAAMAVAAASFGQGSLQFQDLNFEAAQLVPIPGAPDGAVQFGAAFPGWTGYINGISQTITIPNGVPIGPEGSQAFLAIMTPPNWMAQQGLYELGFGSSANATAAIAQTGQVPSSARSMQFLALYAPTVIFGGQVLPTVRMGDGPIYTSLYGVDVSSIAGQQSELRFQTGWGINYLDAISFSAKAIPEPSALCLLGLGALLVGWHSRRSKSER